MTLPFHSESQRYEYDLSPGDIVIDAGGYQGDFAHEMNLRYKARVYCLEPIKEFYENCCQRFKDRPDVTVHPLALHDHNGAVTLGISNNSSGVRSSGTERQACQGVTLQSFMLKHGIDRVALLKLNIESSEFDVLEDAILCRMLPRIDRLQVQWHAIPDFDSRYHKLHDELLNTHEHTWGENPLLWESWTIRP